MKSSATNATSESSTRKFGAPGALDRMLDAKPQPLPAIKPVSVTSDPTPTRTAAKENSGPEATGSTFRIQVDALSDMDAAQARKSALEKSLGEKIDVVFDAPYYKLRFGNFSSQQEAQDKLIDLAGKNIQGFVVRQ